MLGESKGKLVYKIEIIQIVNVRERSMISGEEEKRGREERRYRIEGEREGRLKGGKEGRKCVQGEW